MKAFPTSAPGVCAAVAAAYTLLAPTAQCAPYVFQTLNNNADPTFNQLLGINNAGIIAGYFGSGAADHPNKGYTSPPYSQACYTNENFPGSVQTQVVGINNASSPTTVGFWVDANANNFGFVDQNGVFTSISNPNTPTTGTMLNQLLGVNDSNIAAGFYADANGNSQGFLYNIGTKQFMALTLPSSFNAMMTVATGVNNTGVVTGFYTDANGNVHAFVDNGGSFTSYDSPGGTNTMFLGLNNRGQAVGSFVDANGMTNGVVFNYTTNSWQTVNDPFASATPAFDVTGTTINGINDVGQLVGFYSDGTNVDGFRASQTPEPASIGLMSLGAALIPGLGWRERQRTH